MRSLAYLGLALGMTLFGAPTAWAHDYWDLASNTDDGPQVVNELVHGSSQQHDLETKAGPVADQDWYSVISYGTSSYEAVIDATSGDLLMFQASANFVRMDGTGTTVLQTREDANVGAGFLGGAGVALRWQNTNVGTFGMALNWLRVRSEVCGLACGPEDQYRLRFFDTTIAVPRFNNASGQVTVLIVQNTTSWIRPIAGTVYFWAPGGVTFLGSSTFTLNANEALVLNTSTVPAAASQAGTITISHDGGYGNLAVKSVALEPATGFSFDSPGLYKPQ
jgi:hypothetical protein